MSTIRADSVSPAAGGTSRSLPRGVAAAWANLNGTGTIAGRDSVNIASYTDNGTGDYTENFTSALTNANYAVTFGYQSDNNAAASARMLLITTMLAASVRIICTAPSGSPSDYPIVCSDFKGSLA